MMTDKQTTQEQTEAEGRRET